MGIGGWGTIVSVVLICNGERFSVRVGGRCVYDSLWFSDALEQAIMFARGYGGQVLVECRECLAERSVKPVSRVHVDFGWCRVKLKRCIKSLFYRDFRGRGGLEHFRVNRLILTGNRCELEPPSGSGDNDVRVNRLESFLVRLSNMAGGSDIVLEDIVIHNYYGGPLGITLCPAESCRSSMEGRHEPRPLIGVTLRNAVGINVSTVIPDIRRHYGRDPRKALGSVRNVVVENAELRVARDFFAELFSLTVLG
jgi:hypothetical protein